MSHGREPVYDTNERPMPPIRGVRAADEDEASEDTLPADPWGVTDEPSADPDLEPDHDPSLDADLDPVEATTDVDPTPRRGGGTLTIPLLCIGVAIIACVALLPLADENHQLAWEREKLKVDLAYIQEQTRVQDQFLSRVADDPTLAERLAQRQMNYIREGTTVLPLRGRAKEEMSPFHLVSVPPPPPLPPYQPVGGALATLVRQPRAQLYLYGAALLLIATGLVLGYTPKATPDEQE
jgi:hypothetical protein